MRTDDLSTLPDGSRLWAFAAGRRLGDGEADAVRDAMRRFVGRWTAHSEALVAAFELREDRFLLVAVDESRAAASGCSIDALTHRLRDLERELDVPLLDGTPVWYRDAEGGIATATRSEFRRLAEAGEVGPETPVFDLTVGRLGDLRAGRLERPAARSWHARLLPGAEAAPDRSG